MKKLLSLFLAVMMVVTMLPTVAFADELELFPMGEAPVAGAPTEEPKAIMEEPVKEEQPAEESTLLASVEEPAVISSGEKSIDVKGLLTLSYTASSDAKIQTVGTVNSGGKVYVVTFPKDTVISGCTAAERVTNWKSVANNEFPKALPAVSEYISDSQFAGGNFRYNIYITNKVIFNDGCTLPTNGVKGFAMVANTAESSEAYNVLYVQIAENPGIPIDYSDGETVFATKVNEENGAAFYKAALPYGATDAHIDGMTSFLCRTNNTVSDMPAISEWFVDKEIEAYSSLFGGDILVNRVYSIICMNADQSVKVLIQISSDNPLPGEKPFTQEGTESDPYIIRTSDDLEWISKSAKQGETFVGIYFKFADDIDSVTLPDIWTPLGTTKGFSGTIDGNNKLLIVPENSLSLIGKPGGCTIKNLSIYGEKIPGYGLIEGYTTNVTAKIDNVTIKSGSHILKSGFVGGYGNTSVNISNCTIEKGVVIGDDGTWGDLGTAEYTYSFVGTVNNQDMIGSFCGAWNGSITNCVSYATVYGRNYVGGIVGFKGQSMRVCVINNCAFYGDIIATGEGVGGIVGSGYVATSAPNSPCAVIENCYATGSITGATKVGGIFGGELGVSNCWGNGIGRVRGNYFCGTVTATAEDGIAGGVIGYMKSVDMYNDIQNNYYVNGCGAATGIGAIATVLNKDNASYNIYLNYGRDDDVMNSDSVTKKISKKQLTNGELVKLLNAGKFGRNDWKQGKEYPVFGNEKHIIHISSQNQYDFYVQNPLELSAVRNISCEDINYESFADMDLLVKYSDGTVETVKASEGVFSGVDFTEFNKVQLASVTYGGYKLTFGVKVYKPSTEKIKVSIQVLGDSVHGTDGTVHTLADGNLTEWYSMTEYETNDNTTLYNVLYSALGYRGAGMNFTTSTESYNVARSNYIAAISYNGVTLSSGCNGENSRWNYTINGVNSSVCPAEQYLSDGDVIVLYFTDDMSKELPMGNYDEIQNVKAIIDAIGEVELSSACQSKINAARKAYDKLEEGSKYYVDNYQKLLDAESEYFDLVHADDEPIHIVIGAATNAAAKGEENPNTGAEVI